MATTKEHVSLPLLLFFTLFTITSYGQRNITAEILNYTIPVLKRAEDNSIQRISIYTPSTASAVKSISLKIDPNSIAALDKIIIYNTYKEPSFSSQNIAGTITVNKSIVTVSIDVSLTPGFTYLWVNPVLKEDAITGKYLKMEVTNLYLTNNKIIIPRNTNPQKKGWNTGVCIRKPGDDGVHTYRIPGITKTDKNTLIAVYDIRYSNNRDLPADIDVGMSRSTDGGQTWEPMKVIMKMGEIGENSGIGDPAVLFDPMTKKIWVAALWSKGNRSIAGSEPGLSPDTTGQFVLVSSEDDGKTWSAPINITAQVKNPIWHLYFQGPGNGIAMQNGTLVFPSQYWDESKKPGIPHSSIIYSNDQGKTWKSGIGAKSNTTESQVVETKPGVLMLNMRDNRGSYRSIATTHDLGKTWLEHPSSYNALPDPICMASIIKAKIKVNGTLKDVLFFSNMNNSDARTHLTIKASLDLGETWKSAHKLLIDERKSYGYSSLVQIDENTIGILYEGVRDLNFVQIPVQEIINNLK
ncbi:MAG: exo-alpha-sialidase [Niabella sp.]